MQLAKPDEISIGRRFAQSYAKACLQIDHPHSYREWNIRSLSRCCLGWATELVRFCAFLHPDGIQEELFNKGAPELEAVLGPVGSDSFALNNAILEILKYSLLRRDPSCARLVTWSRIHS